MVDTNAIGIQEPGSSRFTQNKDPLKTNKDNLTLDKDYSPID
jgi:hypothetical protein